MQVQASYIIRQLKQILKHRKYKQVINRIQKLLQKYEQFQYFCMQFHLTLRLVQVRAINKLFQRNLIKKYKYKIAILEYLIDLALRNLNYCQELLKEKIKDQSFFQNNTNAFTNHHFTLNTITVNTFTINSNTNSLQDYFFNHNNKKMKNSIKINNSTTTAQKIKKGLADFFNIYNRTVVLINQMYIIYKGGIESTALGKYVCSCSSIKLQNISGRISQVYILLFYSKHLFLSELQADLLQCQQLIETTIEKLIDIMHQINIVNSKITKMKKQCKLSKYEDCYKECQKLMVICLVLNNKAKMKLGKETIAIAGIELFQSYLQGLSNKYNVFRKLMLPQLYLQEQFIKYRTEKSELVEIITPFFNEKVKYLQKLNKQQQSQKHSLLDFYNKKHKKQLIQSDPYKPKTILNEINTVKSLMATTKHKNNLNVQAKLTKERSSYDIKNKIITNMIISDINQINSQYLQQGRNSQPTIMRNSSNCKSIFYKNNSIHSLKKQPQTYKAQKQNKEDLTYRQRQLFLKQNQYNNFINRQKDRLTRRKQQIKVQIFDNELNAKQQKEKIKQNHASFLKINCKYTQQKSIDIEQKDVKKNMVAITSKKKTQIFIEILFQNKDLLGIRKIAQKVQAIRKKQSEKGKLMNNRLTSSINRQQRTRPSFIKFQVIAKEILRKHISFSNDRPNLSINLIAQQENRKKLIQANYTLGQRSIEAVKEKLQRKINKSEIVVDKYLKNEEVFKLKLKKLGTTNFILKKSNQQKGDSECS